MIAAENIILEDGQLVENCKSGKLDDFGLLYDKYVRKIYDFIYYKTHHKEIAEDLCSKTFMKALEAIKSCDANKGSFKAWIYRIASNTVIDHYRTQKFHYDVNDAWDFKSKDDVMRDMENKEKFDKVRQYVASLKPVQRDIVMLKIWDDMSYKDIAEIVGKSEDNCKMIFSRVMGKFRRETLIAFFIIFFLNN